MYDTHSGRIFGWFSAAWHRNNHRWRALFLSFIQSAHDRIRAHGGILVRISGSCNQRDGDYAGCPKYLSTRTLFTSQRVSWSSIAAPASLWLTLVGYVYP